MIRVARRAAHAGGRPERVPPAPDVQVGIGEPGEVVHGDDHRPADEHRRGVVGRVDHVDGVAAGDAGQLRLLPGQPRRPAVDHRRTHHDGRVRGQTGVQVGVTALGGDDQVGPLAGQTGDQTVEVAADAAPVGRYRRGVDEHARSHH